MLGVSSSAAYGQRPPAIPGFNGTMVTEGTIKKEYKAGNKIIVATEDGVEHAYNATKGLLVHGGPSALEDLKPGTTVVIHYTAEPNGLTAREIDRVGAGGLRTTEGIVTNIDRGKKQITITYDNGASERLELTDNAAADAGRDFVNAPPGTTRIVVYSSQDRGNALLQAEELSPTPICTASGGLP